MLTRASLVSLLLTALPLAVQAAAAATSPSKRTGLGLVDHYAGQSFLSGFAPYTQSDPTHGLVDYVDGTTKNLTRVTSSGSIIMTVDTTTHLQPGQNRES